MLYSEVKLRILRHLSDDFLSDDGNRVALKLMEAAFDKQEPQKSMVEKIVDNKRLVCPVCFEVVEKQKYCHNCGQALT